MGRLSIFSERIKAAMAKQQISQKQLALKANVTESAMSYYVNGERIPRSDILSRIAAALGVSTDYLLGTDTDPVDDDQLQYLQRGLGKLNHEQLDKAEKILKAVFDDIFEDDEGEE